jgi:membrane peptidoglycan carboxypeptidase
VLSHLGVMLIVSVILGVVVSGLAIPFAGVLGFTAKNVADTMDELPTSLVTDELPQKTRIVDRKGETIASLYDENRVNVSLSQISRTMVKAIVAIEDYRFYEHGALDLRGTIRAFLTNAANDGVVQGGSSITQQLVKLTLLSQAKTKAQQAEITDDSYARKLRELRYAIALEQEYSKDWILERYLNTAYFGDGAYGIQSAARHYFDVNARQLNVNQSATLAGLVQNPTAFDPTDYRDRATKRRNVVLDRMAELSVIPEQAAEKIKAKPLGLDPQPANNGCVNSQAPFFCDYVVQYLMEDERLGRTPEKRRERIYTAGLTIRTTIDLDYQAAADRAVENHVNPTDNAIGGLALVEPGTGEVKAIAQSRPMGRLRGEGQTYLNYTVPTEYGDSNGFQAGSTFKVFVLATAIEQGIPLSHVISAPATMSISESAFEDCGGGPYGYGTWDLGNYDFAAHAANLYSGTRLSINTFFAQLEAQTGLCEPFELAKKMGIRLTNPTGPGAERIPSFTLGVADVSPLEMAEAYATFAARGLHCAARPVLEIRDAARNVVRDYPEKCEQVMEQTTADAVNDVLKGVIAPGGFADAQALDQPAAGKTGTTSGGKAVWFVGYTPQMAAAAMIAGANQFGTPIGLDGQYIGGIYRTGASGSAFAAPIWGDAMRVVDDDLEYEDFVYPSTVPGAGVTYVPVPDPPSRNGGGGDGGGDGGGGDGGGDGGGGDGGGNGNGNGGRRGRG